MVSWYQLEEKGDRMGYQFNVLDLFSGAGGMSEGFLQAGFSIPSATDFSKEASETYKNRHKQLGYKLNFFNGDINELIQNELILKDFLNGNIFDVVVGGPPCQGFSLTGKRAENDPRNHLFISYLKMVKIVKPKYFIMENVEGLLSYRFSKIKGIDNEEYINVLPQDVITKEALKLGYSVKWKILNAKDYGVPQNRSRVIFIGHRVKILKNGIVKDMVVPPNFPQPQNKLVSVEDAISDLNFINIGEVKEKYDNRYGNKSDYQISIKNGLTPDKDGRTIKSNILYNHETSKHNERTIERFKLLKQGESINDLMKRLTDENLQKYWTKKYRCQKLKKDEVSPTVLTLPDDIIHYDSSSPRILTVRELARLQSFDDSFRFLGKRTTGGERRKFETPQYTQVGNAVPPLFAKAIADEIYQALHKTSSIINSFRGVV